MYIFQYAVKGHMVHGASFHISAISWILTQGPLILDLYTHLSTNLLWSLLFVHLTPFSCNVTSFLHLCMVCVFIQISVEAGGRVALMWIATQVALCVNASNHPRKCQRERDTHTHTQTHSSTFCCLSGSGLQWQQTKLSNLLPSHIFQLLLGNPEVFPCQMVYVIPPAWSGSVIRPDYLNTERHPDQFHSAAF